MKKQIEKVKSFVKKNEDAILLGIIIVGTATANHAATRAALNSMRVASVGFDKNNDQIHITYKNGDTDRYYQTPA